MPIHRGLAGVLGVAAVLLTACSSTPTTSNPRDAAVQQRPAARLTVGQANDVTLYAISLVGTAYHRGGNTPDTGFDCSGLIGHVYKTRAGIVPPRTVAALKDWGQSVPTGDVRTGDLVVFTVAGATSHAGIYVGEGRFVHAPSTGGEVRLDPLHSKYWSRQQVAYRRP